MLLEEYRAVHLKFRILRFGNTFYIEVDYINRECIHVQYLGFCA